MQPRTPMDIQEMARAFMISRTILTAHELRVFDAIARGHCCAAQIAQAVGTNVRAMDRLLNALVGIGLLTKSEDARFELTDVARCALVRESPAFLGGLDHVVQLWNRWHYLNGLRTEGHSSGSRHEPAEVAGMDRTIHRCHAGQRCAEGG